MSRIQAEDSIHINASPTEVFSVVANYPQWHQWFGGYHCMWLDPNGLNEGSCVSHRYLVFDRWCLSKFDRRIDRIIKGKRLEESYIAGDLRGKGVWEFTGSDQHCLARYSCDVEAAHWFARWSFRLFGKQSHSFIYRRLLHELKNVCESPA